MPGQTAFRVLGSLEVERDGTLLWLGGERTRAVLGVLVFRAGTPVSQESLIDAVWGEYPPPTAKTALQGHISKLRKVLAGDPSVSLQTRGASYVLQLDPDQVDLPRFVELVEEGRVALAAGEPERAKRELESALSLWRGDVLQGLDVPTLVPEIADLDERKLAATIGRIEAELALGRHNEVLSEAEGLLKGHPLDERVHTLAAIALYRSGREADALQVCQRLKKALAEELGMEASPGLQRLELDILNHAPSLQPPPQVPEIEEGTWQGRRIVTALVFRVSPAPEKGRVIDPEAVRSLTAPAMERAAEVIQRFGGVVHESFEGRMVAAFGVEAAHEDDAARALAAAVELHRDHPPGARPEIRIGVATGEALIEADGIRRSLVSAGPVLLAARLAQAAKPGETLLTHTTYRLGQPGIGVEPTEVVLVEDHAEPVVAFRLRGLSRGVQPRRPRSSLVGREAELRILRGTCARVAREGVCSLVTVLGPPGIGKSRLVSEFISGLGDTATVLSGRCLSYGSGLTFWPIAEAIKKAAGITEEDDPAKGRRKIAKLLRDDADSDFLAEQAAGVLGLSDKPPIPDEVFSAIRRLLEAIAYERPVVFVVDDVHWAEPVLLDLIEHVVRWSRDAALLLICTARPELLEARPTWGSGRFDATNLVLHPLSDGDAAQLLENLLRQGALSPGVAEMILDAAEGHPLFLEELVANLIDDGYLRWQGQGWSLAGDLASVPVPLTIQALIDARLDRLSLRERNVLQAAAVIGKEFTHQDLSDTQEEELPDQASVLGRLEERDYLARTATRSFRFRHLLIRDAVYRSCSKEARSRLHERFGTALEERLGERLPEYEEIVGYHLESSYRYRRELGLGQDPHTEELRARAAERLLSSGRRAFARLDMPAVVGLMTRGLALLAEDDGALPEASWLLGVALFETGEFARADEVLESGLRSAEKLGDEPYRWRLTLERSDLRFWREPETVDSADLISQAETAVKALERLEDPAGVARAYRLLGDVLNRMGRQEEAVRAFEEGVRNAAIAGDEREISERQGVGVTLGPMPVESCIRLVEGVIASARRPNVETEGQLGLLYAMQGRFDQAKAILQAALSRAQSEGAEWKAASIAVGLATAHLLADEPSAAETVLRPATEALERMGEQSLLSSAAADLAEALYRQGKHREAQEATKLSEAASAEDDVLSQVAWRGVRAKLFAEAGRQAEAERLAREGVELAERTDFLNLRGDAHVDLALVLETQGRRAQALENVRRAASLFRQKGNVASSQRTEALLGNLQLSRPGTPQQA